MANVSPILEHRKHDHRRCAADAISHAREICDTEGLRFTDGHDSGIYTWSWLRRIALETPPLGEKRGRFVAGRFED